MIPIPVMTTRRMYQPLTDVSVDVRHRIANGADVFLHVVRDLDIELFFKRHDQLDKVEPLEATSLKDREIFDLLGFD